MVSREQYSSAFNPTMNIAKNRTIFGKQESILSPLITYNDNIVK